MNSSLWITAIESSLENESDGEHTHCEFTAVSKITGKYYSVEARSSAPNKSHLDVDNQLVKALRKEATNPRIMMIDVDVPYDPARTEDVWLQDLMRSIKGREPILTIERQPGPPAPVVVTNHPFHYDLESSNFGIAVLTDGFKVSDFGPSAAFNGLIPAFKAKQKHQDLFRLVEAIGRFRIPTTFDGEVPEFVFGQAERQSKIGERYDLSNFPDMPEGSSGMLTTAVVLEGSKAAALSFYIEEVECSRKRASALPSFRFRPRRRLEDTLVAPFTERRTRNTASPHILQGIVSPDVLARCTLPAIAAPNLESRSDPHEYQ